MPARDSISRCCRKVGHCPGIENYSVRYRASAPGATPDTLYDFFPERTFAVGRRIARDDPADPRDVRGDRSRKTTLVEHGFRLPSALDNRPMKFEEWEAKDQSSVFVSATPAITK
jgi:excinuclease ABC subunit B